VLPKVNADYNAPNSEEGIPSFWLTCLKNSEQFAEMINQRDEDVLKHLIDITLNFEESGNFVISFHFSPNTFFEHTTLSRSFILDNKQNIKSIESTVINWNSEDVNPTIEKKKKKVKNSKFYQLT